MAVRITTFQPTKSLINSTMTAAILAKLNAFLSLPLVAVRVVGTVFAVINLAKLDEWVLVFYGVVAAGCVLLVFFLFGLANMARMARVYGFGPAKESENTEKYDDDEEMYNKAFFRTGFFDFCFAVAIAVTCTAVLLFFMKQVDARSLAPALMAPTLILSFSAVSLPAALFDKTMRFSAAFFGQWAYLLAVIAILFFGFALTEAILLLSVVMLVGAGLTQAEVRFRQREMNKILQDEEPEEYP